jgi:uncharacterized membrane protein
MSQTTSVPKTAMPTRGRRISLRRVAFWTVLAVYLALVVGFAWKPTPLAEVLAAIGILVAFAHAIVTYGWRDALALAAICVVITFTMENIGVATGWPFGHYHFEIEPNLPHVGTIPPVVGPLWFGMGYLSWIVAGTLVVGARLRMNQKFELIALPIVAAFVMTQWDVVMDPSESTISKVWVWHQGGAHFGVPLSNYVGWLLTSWLFYQAFAIYLASRRRASNGMVRHGRTLGLVAILLYLASGLTQVTPWLIGQTGEVADAAGHVWRIHDLRETAVVTMLFTMVFTSMLAALRLATDNTHLGS